MRRLMAALSAAAFCAAAAPAGAQTIDTKTTRWYRLTLSYIGTASSQNTGSATSNGLAFGEPGDDESLKAESRWVAFSAGDFLLTKYKKSVGFGTELRGSWARRNLLAELNRVPTQQVPDRPCQGSRSTDQLVGGAKLIGRISAYPSSNRNVNLTVERPQGMIDA
jgi:hypothetical protein